MRDDHEWRFAFELATLMSCPDPPVILRQIGSRRFTDWIAFFSGDGEETTTTGHVARAQQLLQRAMSRPR